MIAEVEGRSLSFLGREDLLVNKRAARRAKDLADVWGFAFDPGSNVVDVCVGRLRAKLGAHSVETVRNVGYRFDAA